MIQERSFHLPVRVYWEDTDAGGVVYYANYLKFMERARSEWLRSLGIDQAALAREERIQFAVVEAQVRYRQRRAAWGPPSARPGSAPPRCRPAHRSE